VGELAARSDRERLRQVIQEHRLWLTMDPRGWEAVGLALHTLSLRDEFLAWAGDWPKRSSFSPELRLALVRALRELGRDVEADDAACAAATDASRSAAVHRLRVWAAVEAAIAGESERSRLALESVDPVLLDDYHRQVRRRPRTGHQVGGRARRARRP
jgi:hypothetical protein